MIHDWTALGRGSDRAVRADGKFDICSASARGIAGANIIRIRKMAESRVGITLDWKKETENLRKWCVDSLPLGKGDGNQRR